MTRLAPGDRALRSIGIIGSGNVGMAVARLSVTAGIHVQMANSRGPESLIATISDLGGRAAAVPAEEIATDVDLVLVAIPLGAYPHLSADSLADAIVIDAMNYFPQRDGDLRALDSGETTQTELIQSHLPRSRVVKTLNTIDFLRMSSLATPAASAERTALPVSGDDAAAKALAQRFLDLIGFDTVDIGGLDESWRIEPNAPAYVEPYFRSRPEDHDFYSRLIHAQPVSVSAAQLRTLCDAAQRGIPGIRLDR
ncbi:NADPH-dependent F420 reductase [Microbacterium sp. NPDC056044]|uniref:NADPH-dependent F420 reductase n=1 Tax=Microbacterium sp. NPDC056044 TaxID=3345690 RepID=UPI0035E1ECC4